MKRIRTMFAAAFSVSMPLLAGAAKIQAQPGAKPIQVQNVEELYAAVNGQGHEGAVVQLSPGTYVLTTFTSFGAPRPHHGALSLPRGMSLVGSEEHVDTDGDGVLDPVDPNAPDVFAVPGTETVIDGSGLVLPPEQRADCTGDGRAIFPDPVIFIGRDNAISALTIQAGGNLAVGEPTNEPTADTRGMSIDVTDTIFWSGIVALDFSNSECAARHARSILHLSHSVVHGAAAFGVGVSNFYTGDASNDPSEGPEIDATMTFNLFYENGTALRAAGGDEGTDGGFVKLHTTGNVFRSNQTNLQGRGCVGRVALPTVGDRLVIDSENDTFGEAPVNILLTAGVFLDLAEPEQCSLEAHFLQSRFIRDSDETPPEFAIVGGDGGGSDNHALVLIRRATVRTSDGINVEGDLSIEDETGSGERPNTARLQGSRRSFIQTNQGLPAPPAQFFVGR